MARDSRTIFLDANVLAAPVTRTLLLVGIEAIATVAVWSRHAEAEANRHLPPSAMLVTDLRTNILEAALSRTGDDPARFRGTKGNDRQILADAIAARAGFLITSDVDDFAETDLVAARIAAVNPDLFMALRFTEAAYKRALTQLTTSLANPPRTTGEMHRLIGRRHPRLYQRFAHVYDDEPLAATEDHEPRVLYRGSRCVGCGRPVRDPMILVSGCHPTCLSRVTAG